MRARSLPDTGAWCMEIRDNGRGMEPPGPQSTVATGKGMAGMAHRATLAGGDLQVLQGEHGGTCIRVVVPRARAT
ncbi:Histidine kinase-, DNA gyrase B-, and HSP90-like ATPase [compost metagenome]